MLHKTISCGNSRCQKKQTIKKCTKTAGAYILLVCTLLLSSACGTSDSRLTKSSSGEPCSDWGKSPTGSAKYLDGDTVLVSIFLDDADASWTKADKTLVKKNLKIACEYLEEEGRRYGREVNLIYDIDAHPDLEYHYKTDSPFPGSSMASAEGAAGEAATQLLTDTSDYIDFNINTENILSAYDVNSIGFLVFIDNTADAATTYPYYAGSNGNPYSELCFINLRWSGVGYDVPPETYAHEILHLFGARDLYRTSQSDGITREYVDYVFQKYPKDIMLGSSRKAVDWRNKVSGQITDVTAYYIGWKDTVYETDLFPATEAKYRASFIYEEPSEDFEEYTAPTRSWGEKTFLYTLFYSFIVVVCIGIDIKYILKNRQNKTYG